MAPCYSRMHGYTYSRPDRNVEGAMQGENMLELFQMFGDNEKAEWKVGSC